jgi:hypothetical protein
MDCDRLAFKELTFRGRLSALLDTIGDLLLIEMPSIQLAHLTVVAGRAHPSKPELAEISDFVPGAKA